MSNTPQPPSGFSVSGPDDSEAAAEAANAADSGRSGKGATLPPVDFQTLVISLGSSVLMHLGLMPSEAGLGGPVTQDLAMAKHSIDVLAMLQEKTRGNLSSAEADLLQGLLYDLRIQYIEAARK